MNLSGSSHDRSVWRTLRRSAFTLIELLVVVSIVTALVSILVPSLHRARAQAKEVVCQSQLRQIGIGLWNYMTESNGHLPYVKSPMTNGNGLAVPGFGNPNSPSADIDPFDRQRWPLSLANLLMPTHVGNNPAIFVCPSAVNGWPKETPYRYTYREAAANQPNGLVSPEGSYFRENFGFLDGRVFNPGVIKYTGNPIVDAQLRAREQSTFLRDFVTPRPVLHGPHRQGINVLDRRLAVQFRNQKFVADYLGGFGTGVAF